MIELFESQSTYHLYGSSVLFVYDSMAALKFHKGEIDEEKVGILRLLRLLMYGDEIQICIY